MKTKKFKMPTASEQQMLEETTLRLVREDELPRYNEMIEKEHYLHNAAVVGETLRYVAEHHGEWVGLLTWVAGSYHLKDREAWIGWDRTQLRRRLVFVVNNSRFLMREGLSCPNLASRCMKLCLQRLSADWQARYQHPVLVAESFVDSQLFRGTAYKASGWELLGQTQGYGRVPEQYYTEHDRPKQLWGIELQPGARRLLCRPELPEDLRKAEHPVPVVCQEPPRRLKKLCEVFEAVPEFRKGRIRYPLPGVLTLIFCAMLCGVGLGQRALAEFASELSQPQLRALGFRARQRKTRSLIAPQETTFYRVLSQTNPQEVEKALLGCLDKLLGPVSEADRLVTMDGKALRSSQGVQLFSAFTVGMGRWLGTEMIEEKSNEIPAARKLLARIPLEQALVVPDALHTQAENARRLVMECGADYFLTVKGNQPDLKKTLDQLLERQQTGAFSPSARLDHRRV